MRYTAASSILSAVSSHGLKYLTIGAYSPITPACQWTGGRAVKQIIELALSQVNNRTDILPGYELQMVLNDTKVCAHYKQVDIFNTWIIRSRSLIYLTIKLRGRDFYTNNKVFLSRAYGLIKLPAEILF